ncbi:hypothetical protein QBC33DRAFT_448506 [Phialemonium atrogriseum]|uniref:Uncharacterized protein n=1 Tax=Phialemonium atrogriseum TaxID=1093897 RepID=A0AAJ0FMW2_9PEZI|nr:uncharacterized protein QBC33DRAFT_448506 [Phialemonium atrogriseum]KAK1768673.1 hypothetical protein QBC33DRAFT_448506 [Phialemonium atrogriseum]
MLRRQSTRSKSDLRRRKSTTSVHSVHLERLDAAIAQRDAQSAAQSAFSRARAKNRSNTDTSLFPPPPVSPPRRHQIEREEGHQGDAATADNGNGVYQRTRRQQSVRFVGPCSNEERTPNKGMRTCTMPNNMRQAHLESSDRSNLKMRDYLEGTISQDTYPPEPSREAPALPYSTVSEVYLHALLAGDENYTPEDDIASAPSSYRRIRRSKSMLPGRNSTRDSRGIWGPASSRLHAAEDNKENVRPGQPPALRTPKSMSFLNPHRRGEASLISRKVNRDTSHSLEDGQQDHAQFQSLDSKSLISRGPNPGRAEFGMRRSLRSSSSNSGMPPPTRMPSIKVSSEDGLKTRARNASRTLKTRLRKFFTLSKTEEETGFPEQHIQSRKTHASEPTRSRNSSASQEGTWPRHVGGSIHNVASAVPSFHHLHPSAHFNSRNGSMEDLTSERQRIPSDDKSRVTSWTGSSASTLTSQQRRESCEGEEHQLSIIKESDSQPLPPSNRRPGFGNHQLQSQESFTGQPIPPGPTVDSQRIYSALIKRLHDTKQLPLANPNHAEIPDGSTEAPKRGSYMAYPEASGDGKYPIPPAKLAPCPDGPQPSGRTISDRRSAFFGSPDSHLFRTASPYRRALQKSMEQMVEATSHGPHVVGSDSSDTSTQIHRTVPKAPDEAAYSESMYSCVTGEDGANTSQVWMTLPSELREPPSIMGDASISPDPPVTYRPTEYRVVSSVSSVDWKTWLSANVAKLEPSSSPSRLSEVEFASPTMQTSFGRGHVRESAQIEGDEDVEDEELSVPATRRFTLPISPLAVVEPNVVKVSTYQRSVKTIPLPEAGSTAEKDDPNYTWEQYKAPNPGAPQTTPVSVNHTPKGSPAPLPGHTKLRRRRGQTTFCGPAASSWRSPLAPSIASSPGLTAAVERQFGSLAQLGERRRGSGENKENEAVCGDMGGGGAGLFGSGEDVRAMGSKRMVDLFLSSRRRRVVGSDESDAFV